MKILLKNLDIRVLKKKFNSFHILLLKEISFTWFSHVCLLCFRTNNNILVLKSTIYKQNLSKLVKCSIPLQDLDIFQKIRYG